MSFSGTSGVSDAVLATPLPARLRDRIPIGRVGTLDEIIRTVLWLASDEAGFAVGPDLVDGGAAA
ncbi:SDR family oxidoreductase [Sphaerimonospora sp. CA-214678]|uniref:SDR family oxidoreductase n=1 Tax=Sphaerimonospora sp. CA-214678 TaxID=3240029 RepID=UPI003D8AD6C5